MYLSGYLIISSGGTMAFRVNRPGLNSEQVCFKITVNLPSDFFRRVIPEIKVDVPKEAIFNPDAALTLNLMSDDIANKLGIEVSEVRDGLTEMLKKKLEKENNAECS